MATVDCGGLRIAVGMAAENPDFDRVWKNLQAFRADYKVWKDLAYLD